ncbi:hypothetical protein PBI_THONKO_84 [Mycobacterium phage Thonko]|uniref:Uncharacterized protein n=1 Tax=Mycobacterium phage Thonko TaxID=2282910 RepID=A0A346FCD0_9CAUD|nr:hypothetical protein I5G57_gp084 [Mycobacterium phage Thonko]AXN53355.1 hypothetical protein PBI_THONKO_84 [Mycobacterium phage Thonko]
MIAAIALGALIVALILLAELLLVIEPPGR